MVKITHLSLTVKNPEIAARALAEMTNGTPKPFISKNMPGAWLCVWNEETNSLIEFLPDGYLMHPTEYGADFVKLDFLMNYNSTHFQLEVKTPLEEIQRIANQYNFKNSFRPHRGGPLYDVWFEKEFLVEFVSDEIRSFGKEVR